MTRQGHQRRRCWSRLVRSARLADRVLQFAAVVGAEECEFEVSVHAVLALNLIEGIDEGELLRGLLLITGLRMELAEGDRVFGEGRACEGTSIEGGGSVVLTENDGEARLPGESGGILVHTGECACILGSGCGEVAEFERAVARLDESPGHVLGDARAAFNRGLERFDRAFRVSVEFADVCNPGIGGEVRTTVGHVLEGFGGLFVLAELDLSVGT